MGSVRAEVLQVWAGGHFHVPSPSCFHYLLFPLSFSHEVAAEFSRGTRMWDIASDRMLKQNENPAVFD